MIRVQEVIIAEITKGDGTAEDPCRVVMQIWSKEGELLAEKDPNKEDKAKDKNEVTSLANAKSVLAALSNR